jgi:hypothetical protein
MMEFFEKTWLFWWVFCIVVTFLWFQRVSSMGEVDGEIESTSTETSAAPSLDPQILDHPNSGRNRRWRFPRPPKHAQTE